MLVAPIIKVNPLEERVIEFKGLNRRPMIDDGEMRESYNLGAEDYPNLSQRRPRTEFTSDYIHPVQMIVKDEKLAVIDRVAENRYKFYFNGELCSSLEWTTEPKMVAIGSKICFFAGSQHHWYQVKTTDDINQGATGTLDASVQIGSSVGLWLGEDELELSSGRQYMYEFMSSMTESSTEGPGAAVSALTEENVDLTVYVGQRGDDTTQVKVSVEGAYTDIRFVTFEVGTQPISVGTYEWRYAGYAIPTGGTLHATDYIDLRGYVYENGISIRVRCFAESGTVYTDTVDMSDYGWTDEAFALLNKVPRMDSLFKVDDVVDVKGKAEVETFAGDMTEAEYNVLAEDLDLPTGTGTVDMSITPSEYNQLAVELGLDAEISTQVDGTITEREATTLAQNLGLSVANEDMESAGDIDTASVIASVSENDIVFADSPFLGTITMSSDETITTDSGTAIYNASPIDFPKPTAWYVVRSKTSPAKCTVLWTVECTSSISETKDDTIYQIQAQEEGTDEAWQTVLTMSSAKGNLPAVKEDGTSFFATDVQVPSVGTAYNFRVIATNAVRTTGKAQSGTPSTGYPRCIGRKISFRVIGSISVERNCPDLDYVCEYNNRLWGCNSKDNEILASKLGDPTNWHYYQATSMDSFAASQGTDGKWTGCGVYSNHLLFFKEECIHKIYGSSPSTFQITTQTANGVKNGSEKSVVIIEDMIIYHSRIGWMAYTGDVPELISAKLGETVYSNAVAGADGKKYYCSALNADTGDYDVLVFDSTTGFWLQEDNTQVLDFCNYNGSLMYIPEMGEDRIYSFYVKETEFVQGRDYDTVTATEVTDPVQTDADNGLYYTYDEFENHSQYTWFGYGYDIDTPDTYYTLEGEPVVSPVAEDVGQYYYRDHIVTQHPIMVIGSGNEDDIRWRAVFGEFDEVVEDKKVVSKLKMRLTPSEGSTIKVFIKIDYGEWELLKTIEGMDKAQVVPIVPRRCDRYSVKLEGKGKCRIESLMRTYRQAAGRL